MKNPQSLLRQRAFELCRISSARHNRDALVEQVAGDNPLTNASSASFLPHPGAFLRH